MFASESLPSVVLVLTEELETKPHPLQHHFRPELNGILKANLDSYPSFTISPATPSYPLNAGVPQGASLGSFLPHRDPILAHLSAEAPVLSPQFQSQISKSVIIYTRMPDKLLNPNKPKRFSALHPFETINTLSSSPLKCFPI